MNKRILNLAIPNIISNITVPLLGIVDLALVGHLGSAVFIGAIAVGGMIFNAIYWGFGFLRMGTSGLTAQALGARKLDESITLLARAMGLAILFGLLLIMLSKPIGWISFRWINAGADVELWAASYFYIRIFAAPATLGLYVISGWFIGMQNSKTPMIVAIVVNLLNIVFNTIFVYVLDLKSDGVAWGTLIAQYLGLGLAIILFLRFYGRLLPYFSYNLVWIKARWLEFFNVNRDIFIRTLFLIFVLTFFTAQSAKMGDTLLAVNTLLLQFFMFFSYFQDGFAYSAEALVGRSLGAKNHRQLRMSIRLLMLWGFGISLIFTILYLFFDDFILKLLTDNAEVLTAAQPYAIWVALIPLLSFASFIWDGVYIGATASKAMRNTMIGATAVFVPLYYLLLVYYGNHALWIALLAFLFMRGLGQTLLAPYAIFKKMEKSV